MRNVSKPNLKRVLILFFWAAVVVFAAVSFVSQQIKINAYNEQIARLDESVATLTEYATELETQSDLYSSDEYIAELARTRLGYVRSDEVVFRKAED